MGWPIDSGGLQRYRRVLRAPQVTPLLAGALVAVLPVGMGTLAVVVFVERQTGSYAPAGLVAAALAFGAAVATPVLGRLIDRVGQPRVLVPCAVVSPVGLASIVPVAHAGASVGVLGAVAFVAGSSAPPVLSCLRSMWPALLGGDDHLVRAGLALDALLLEAAFIVGPLVTAVLIAAVSPESALLVAAGATMAGTFAFAAASPMRNTRAAARPDQRLLGPLRAQGLQTILLATFPVGVLFGGFDVIAPAIGDELAGRQSVGGLLIALTAVGSTIGGVWWGMRPAAAPLRGYVSAACLMPLGLILVAVPDTLAALALLALLFGMPFAPFSVAGGELVHRLAPGGMGTESFTWITTALIAGAATGQAITGPLIDHAGWRTAALACATVGTVGAALVLARRSTLTVTAAADLEQR